MGLVDELEEATTAEPPSVWRPDTCTACAAAMALSEEDRAELIAIYRGELRSAKTNRPYTDEDVAGILTKRSGVEVRFTHTRSCRRYHHAGARRR